MYKLIIFDLDGTLLNTIDDIKDSLNFAVEKQGLPSYSVDKVKKFVGSGVKQMIVRALEGLTEDKSLMQIITKDYTDKYNLIQKDKTKPYDNIIETLNRLKEKGITLAVLSNKPIQDTKNIISYYFNDSIFDSVFGQIEGIPVKPDPTLVHKIINNYSFNYEEVLFIGDSDVDMMTAKNANVDSVFVSWGFRNYEDVKHIGIDYVVTDPLEIISIIK